MSSFYAFYIRQCFVLNSKINVGIDCQYFICSKLPHVINTILNSSGLHDVIYDLMVLSGGILQIWALCLDNTET